MALYGTKRDISLFRHVNRELMGNIISQECVYYKFKLDETKVNLYGESVNIFLDNSLSKIKYCILSRITYVDTILPYFLFNLQNNDINN